MVTQTNMEQQTKSVRREYLTLSISKRDVGVASANGVNENYKHLPASVSHIHFAVLPLHIEESHLCF